MAVDLNADLAEGLGPWRMGDDEALLDVLSSANLACGFHAGDPLIMLRTVRLAMARGVDIGAHVGFPDRQGFGRRIMHIDPAELAAMVIYQLGALDGITRSAGGRMTHMSFHGALGNMVAADRAGRKGQAVADFNSAVDRLLQQPRHQPLPPTAAWKCDDVLPIAYDDDGLLVRAACRARDPRPGAVIERVRTCSTAARL